jgi:hypothetical protein
VVSTVTKLVIGVWKWEWLGKKVGEELIGRIYTTNSRQGAMLIMNFAIKT